MRLAINNASASWNVNFRRRGLNYEGQRHPQRTLKIGDLSSLSPNAARLKAEEIKAEVRNGGDPLKRIENEKRMSSEAEHRDRPLKIWLEEYRNEILGTHTKYKNTEYVNTKMTLSELGMLASPASKLSVFDLIKIAQIHREKPATGRQRFGSFSRFIDYLVLKNAIELNPAKKLLPEQKPKAAAPREVFYSVEELRSIWYPKVEIRSDYLKFVRFLMIMPLRVAEASELTGLNIFLTERDIRLSTRETKNKNSFVIPFPNIAIDLIDTDRVVANQKIFPLSRFQTEPMRAWSYFNRQVRAATGLPHFACHHFRRTFCTLISERTSFPESLVDSLLNHKRSATRHGVMRHYQHAKNLNQRREIMDWWGNFLKDEVINGSL